MIDGRKTLSRRASRCWHHQHHGDLGACCFWRCCRRLRFHRLIGWCCPGGSRLRPQVHALSCRCRRGWTGRTGGAGTLGGWVRHTAGQGTCKMWSTKYLSEYWKSANYIALLDDNRWVKRILHWNPGGGRPGRPFFQRQTPLQSFCRWHHLGNRIDTAGNTDLWFQYNTHFISFYQRLC